MATSVAKKDNVIGSAWRNVACPLYEASDPISWFLLLGVGVLVVASCLLQGTGAAGSFYGKYYAMLWYGAWLLLVLATVGPILNLTKQSNEVPLDVLIGVAIGEVAIFVLICVCVLVRQDAMAGLTALMAATAAAMMAGVGWVVQHQSSARASRRAHTFGVLMQSRLSGEFQDQVRRRASVYGSGNAVTAADAPLVKKAGLKAAIDALDAEMAQSLAQALPNLKQQIQDTFRQRRAEVRRKHRSLDGVSYLLNFYEFICAGISRRELDERLLWDTLSDIAIALHRDTEQVRAYLRKTQPKVYEHFDELIGGYWSHGNRKY